MKDFKTGHTLSKNIVFYLFGWKIRFSFFAHQLPPEKLPIGTKIVSIQNNGNLGFWGEVKDNHFYPNTYIVVSEMGHKYMLTPFQIRERSKKNNNEK